MPLSPYFNIGGGGGGVSYGNPFVLFDASGEATSYATYADAVAVAVAGQTIHMVTDVTETSATECILKDGVNVNLNGNTYTLNVATTEDAFTDNASQVTCTIYNGTIRREGGTYSSVNSLCLHLDSSLSKVDLEGVVCESSFGCTATTDGILNGGTFKSEGGAISYRVTSQGEGMNANIYAVNGCRLDGSSTNIYCYATTGTGVTISGTGEFVNITGISAGNYGLFFNTTGRLFNCTGISFASFGLWHSGSGTIYDCYGYSNASIGLLQGSVGGFAFSSRGESTGNIGYSCAGENQGCQGVSSASVAVRVAGGKFYGGNAYNKWNNAGGHAFQSTVLNSEIFGSTGIVTNSGAFGVYVNNSAFNCFFGSNEFEGCAQILSTGFAGVVNLQTNAPDTEGNILKG